MTQPLAGIETCALCPRLCRHACPGAEGTRREAAVPAVIGETLLAWRRGAVDASTAAGAATLCVDCGRCREACHLHRPLPELLREARAALLPEPVVGPLGTVDGEGADVAVEADARAWSGALATRLGRPVARLGTRDGLGAALRGFSGWPARAGALRDLFGTRRAVVADGASHGALAEAGVAVAWLHEVLPDLAPAPPSCAQGAVDCCGGAWPLVEHHPDDARRMARRASVRGAVVGDARCRGWLRACDLPATDPVDLLLEGR